MPGCQEFLTPPFYHVYLHTKNQNDPTINSKDSDKRRKPSTNSRDIASQRILQSDRLRTMPGQAHLQGSISLSICVQKSQSNP